MEASWYVIHTKPRQEVCARDNLKNQGYETYLPMLRQGKRRRGKWVKTIEPLFPRYLFIRLALNVDNVAPIRSTKGVSTLVRFGDTPATVSDTFIATLRQTEDPELGCHRQERSRFKKGTKATIIEGPFAGVTGIIDRESGDERVFLLLDILGRQNRVAIPTDDLIPAEA